MRYIHFHGENGYCGTDYDEFEEFPDDTPDADINEISNNYGRDNAESFSYMETGWDEDFESEEAEEAYYEDALSRCYWEEVSAEEYERLKEDLT